MGLSKFFKAAAASAAILGGGYAGYTLAPQAEAYLADQPLPAVSREQRAAVKQYDLLFTTVLSEQQILDNSTDQEEAGLAFDEKKKALATDAVLDKNLSEKDLLSFAARFNAISQEDGIRLRSYNFDPRSISRRDECLVTTPASNDEFGDDRYAYAQRVETCMIDRLQAPAPAVQRTAEWGLLAGGLGGGVVVGGFALGGRGRRKPAPATPA